MGLRHLTSKRESTTKRGALYMATAIFSRPDSNPGMPYIWPPPSALNLQFSLKEGRRLGKRQHISLRAGLIVSSSIQTRVQMSTSYSRSFRWLLRDSSSAHNFSMVPSSSFTRCS
ncbi:hypothetical protein GW17_00042450, partial [Ensete ventricosum]